MSATDELLEHARRHAAAFDRGHLEAPPARRVAVVTCMDARIDPRSLFGLADGDAHVLRNAGGVVTDDTIRSLCISQLMLGTEEVLLVHHTECGLLGLDDTAFADRLEAATGARPGWRAQGFADLDESVRADMARIRTSGLVPRPAVRGFVYDVKTGALREVPAA